VLGILSFFTCFITAIPAIILGVVGLLKINRSAGQLKGTGLAVAGMALPALAFPIIMLMAILMPALSRTRALAQRRVCATNMRGLGTAMMVYTNDYGRKFPTADQWCDLLIEYADVDPKSFQCKPGAGGEFSYGFNENLDGLGFDDASADTVMLFEIVGGRNVVGGPELLSTERHNNEGCNIVFADGHAQFVQTHQLGDLKWMVQ
jgi:prepilin-type processing-associated H-X9-DG protein